MSTREKLLRHKDLFYKNKKDVRFLQQAILDMTFELYQKEEYQDCVKWIGDEIIAEFEKKSATQNKNAEIGALVAHVVFHGADVLSTIEAVSEWLVVSITTVRDSYSKIKKTFDFDPKKDQYNDCNDFQCKYGYIPLVFVRQQFNKNKPFPGTAKNSNHEHYKVWRAMIAAHDTAIQREQEMTDLILASIGYSREDDTQK